MPTEGSPARIVVGRIVGPWGLRGQLRVQVLSDNPKRFAPGAQLWVADEPRTIQKAHRRREQVILELAGVNSLEAAEALRGCPVEVAVTDVAPLPPGEYYRFQVLGLAVYTVEGRYLGRVTEVLATGGNDVYVVEGDGPEILIPALAEVIKAVDLKEERLVIEPLPGLLEPEGGG